MELQKKQKRCKACNGNVLAERKGTNHLLHFFLSLFTLGFWVIIWILHSIKIGGWKCPKCGSRV